MSYNCDYPIGTAHCNMTATLLYTHVLSGILIITTRCACHPISSAESKFFNMRQVTPDELEDLQEAARVHAI